MPDDPRVRAVRLVGQLIDRDYTRSVGPVVRAIAANSERGALGKRLKELEAEAARLAEAGKRLTPDNAIARALLSDLDDALRANAALIDGVADDIVASGVRNAGAMVRGGALAGMTDAQLAALGVAWNVPDPEAVARLVQYTGSDAWTAALEKYQEGTGKVAQNALTRAFIEGKGPIAAARELRAAVTGLPVAYAEQMTRTLQLTSLRDSAVAHRVANSHIIEYQIRIAALDDRTCFPAGTLIATDNGQKPIEAVVVGDRVLTHTGKYRRVSATMRRVYSGQMVTLRHSRGSVVATANHPVLVNREGYGDWIPAEGVKVGDEVVVSGKYGGNYRNHAFGRVAIKRGVGNTDHGIPARGQPRSFLAITGGASMPIDAINFKRDIQAGQIEVNWITINARLLFVRLAKRLKAETNVALRFCFAYIAAIAARRAKLFMSICGHNSELFAARQTSVDHGRAAAFFRTVASLIAVSGEHFATPFARRIFGFCRSALAAANSVAVCVGAWHGEGLAADGANLFNRMSLMSARRPAVASVAFSDFGGAQFESLAADGTGELDSLTLAQSATGGATVHTVIAPFVEVGLPNIEGLAASGAGSLYHDEIISKTATQVKNAEVFNLEVERDHTYVANGLVVHNCASCVALHGTELPLDARIDDHHRGRCTSVTKVRGMAAPAVESGPDWFARQSEDRQRAMMGGARFEAWKAGAIQWGDMSRVYDDPVFGRMVGEASLKGMLGKAEARTFYRGGSAVTERAPVSLGEQARQQLRAIATETDERVKQIVAEREALHEANMRVWDYMDTDQFRALSREEKDAIWDKLEIDTQKIGTLYEAERQELLKVTERIRNEVLYVDNPAQFQAKLTAGAKGRAGIPDGVADFRRMVSADVIPEGSSVNVQLTRRVRSYASGDVIYMDKSAGARTTVHELGHWLETVNPDVHQAAIDFLDKRTKGDDLQNLTELRPGLGYRPDEKARPDAFFDPYVGKDYGGRASEVVSMGMEYMYAEPVRFMTEDPEHFDLVYGLLRGKR